ncbi:MAG: DEAD/DEAH box helicase family protein [Candidatus Riflebacteria bacterium]|nr:DEAD/DEAH box helicase family protein [Candidatus Riflebacteria bacterium]
MKSTDNKKLLLEPEDLLPLIENGGSIADAMPDYEEREGQIAMMETIIKALNSAYHALLEGETGIGKSMAYLIPAIYFSKIKNKPVVVSTNTINLQHQLVSKDLPFLNKSLETTFKYALLKGRQNYLCLRRLNDALYGTQGDFLLEDDEYEQFQVIKDWADDTEEGTIAELPFIPLESLWSRLECDKDSCLGFDCYEYNACYYYNAKKTAASANIIVVNHHLLFSDLAMRADSTDPDKSGVIPNYSAVIADEAHNIEDTATTHFGFRTTFIGIQKLLNKIFYRKGNKTAGLLSNLAYLLSTDNNCIIKADADEMLQACDELSELTILAGREAKVFFDNITGMLTKGSESIGEYKIRIRENHENTDEFITLAEHSEQISTQIKFLHIGMKKLANSLSNSLEDFEDSDDFEEELEPFKLPKIELQSFSDRLLDIVYAIELMFNTETENRSDYVHFMSAVLKRSGVYTSFSSLPLFVGKLLAENFFDKVDSAILVSGTMSTAGNFNFVKERLDLQSVSRPLLEGSYASPFDYRAQTSLIIPDNLPSPLSPDFTEQLYEPLAEIIMASGGGALVLCTSYRQLNSFHSNLEDVLASEGIASYRQGSFSRNRLIDYFKEDGNSVLFGTYSFWEGVDISGYSLRNLIIMKLPFAPPDDPLLEARGEHLRSQGKNPFFTYQVPMAAIKLKQGFGRLIRSKTDRGIVWIMDNRILTKSYGKHFLDSLPDSELKTGPFNEMLSYAEDFYRI